VRISGPRGSVAPGSHAISVRLLADDRPVKNGYVRVEKKTASGWVYAGRLLTNADGLGAGKFSFPASTRLRAVYQGAATRTAATSSEIVVKVVSFRQQALNVAAQQNGKPYSYGSDGPNSFDCSGLVRYAFSKVGRNLPHSSSAQASETQRIAKDSAQPGDLIFISSGGRVSHVGVYAGGGMFWDAPTSGGHVSKRRIWTSSYFVGRVS
jgi:cell wall-associated NlpC family hydrolase